MYTCDLELAKLHNKMLVIPSSKGSGAGTLAYKAPEMFIDFKRSTPGIYIHLGVSSLRHTKMQEYGVTWMGTRLWARCLATSKHSQNHHLYSM